MIVVDEKLRTEWFEATGWYGSDDAIREWAAAKRKEKKMLEINTKELLEAIESLGTSTNTLLAIEKEIARLRKLKKDKK